MLPFFIRDYLKVFLFFACALFIWFVRLFPSAEREYIYITGSSTVAPFSVVSGEYFAKFNNYPIPVVDSMGTGSGIKLFCSGMDLKYPDIVNASRRISDHEMSFCAGNGIKNFSEHIIGYDGIVLIRGKNSGLYGLTDEELFLALSKYSVKDGKLVPNHYEYWSDINPILPRVEIAVFGPSDNSGTREVFIEQVMVSGMEKFLNRLSNAVSDEQKFALTYYFREDGAFIKTGDNSNIVIQKISNKSHAIGIITYSFLGSSENIVPIAVNNVLPTDKSISSGNYLLSRPLFMYVKDINIPGLLEFIEEVKKNTKVVEMGLVRTRGNVGK